MLPPVGSRDAQADLSLCCPYMPEDTIRKVQPIYGNTVNSHYNDSICYQRHSHLNEFAVVQILNEPTDI